MSSTEQWPQYRHDVQYSDESRLNTLELCFPRPTTSEHEQLWVIYLHGGAWQDPEIDASSFRQAQDALLEFPEAEQIAGLASINYRLSPYPSHPRDPSTRSDPARNARHPDHVDDVLTAIRHLQQTFAFGNRYILVGHSCGATLAFQVALDRQSTSKPSSEPVAGPSRHVIPPIAILGVEGLYDLPALVKYHHNESVYWSFVTNAFGSVESVWKAVSPTRGDYDATWSDGRLVVIAHSREDELVEWDQADLMHQALVSQGWDEARRDRELKVIELRGKHDEVWQTGVELARAIVFTLQRVTEQGAG